MFDLAITSKGDLIFEQTKKQKTPFKLKFFIGNSKALNLHFSIEDTKPLKKPKNGLCISFDLKNNRYNKRAILYSNKEALLQAIRIRLQTTIGDTESNIGSKLELIKHERMYDAKTLEQAKKFTYEAIQDILPNAKIIVSPIINKSKTYEQKLNIFIYDQEDLILKYDLKE